MDEVQRAGRIEYIEPNTIFKNTIQEGIPQPYEDYSISVNLRVINGNRYDCGMPRNNDDGSQKFIEFSSDNGTITFMDGTTAGDQSYLTTNFTDISMNDPSTNTKESLGIERISIRYDSWFFPTVDIKFVDVRGASLMQPAEYEYYNTGGPNKNKTYSKSSSDFFKAFFSFPYPMFKLSVKGFYGKEVTYDLSVLKCNVEFNSSTGNFEMNASFIGYMYGMYADFPFSFLYVAPYIDPYGKNTWNEKTQGDDADFRYFEISSNGDNSEETMQGRTMYTFPELKAAVGNAEQECEKVIGSSDSGQTRTQLKELINNLKQGPYFNFPTEKKITWWSWSKTNTNKDSSGYFFISIENSPEKNREIFNTFYTFVKDLEEYNENANKSDKCPGYSILTQEIFDNIYKRGKEEYDKVAPAGVLDDAAISRVFSGNIVDISFYKNSSGTLVYDKGNSNFGLTSEAEFLPLINELKERYESEEVGSPMVKKSSTEKWNIKAFKISNIYYKNVIVETLNKLEKKYDELDAKLNKLQELDIYEAIGFKPTIRNLYNMVFAHADTFMSVFYSTLDRIRKSLEDSKDETRKYTTLCGGNIQVDVSDSTLARKEGPNAGKLPPFTLFMKEEPIKDSEGKNVTMIWPGSLNGGKELDEVKLVESILEATQLKKRSTQSVTKKHNITERKGDLVPTNYYDLIRDGGNPYLDALSDKSQSANDVAKIFMLRCYYSLLNGSYVEEKAESEKNGIASVVSNFTKKAKLIAQIEAGNVMRAFQMIKSEPNGTFIDELRKITDNGSDFMSQYLVDEKKNHVFTSVGTKGDLTYEWIKVRGVDFYSYPIGVFSSQKLEKYVIGEISALTKDVDKFLQIGPNGTTTNAYGAHLYSGGKYIEKIFQKNGTGEFADAARLFKNHKSVPEEISEVAFYGREHLKLGKLYSANRFESIPLIPSARKTSAGYTSVFMDPLYYSQETKTLFGGMVTKDVEARAYLFLMGIPYGNDKKFFIPKDIENGDYPTLMLLREGAIYWRNDFIRSYDIDGSPIIEIENDPITYTYTIKDATYDALPDIEVNDPCFGLKYAVSSYDETENKVSEGRKKILIDYFLKWANGTKTNRNATVTGDSYVNVETPMPVFDFPTIEKKLALYETVVIENGTKSQLLSKNSPLITAATVSSFANISQLKDVYYIDSKDELGKLNGNIRTGVTLNISQDNESDEARQFFVDFAKFYYGFDTIIDYSTFDGPNGFLTVPRNAMNDAMSEFIKQLKDNYGISDSALKESNGTETTGNKTETENERESTKDENLKLSCYLALKNIYDKWFCSSDRKRWRFSINPEKMKGSDFSKFYYIDEFYHDIGMEVYPNLSRFTENINGLGGFTSQTTQDNLASVSIMSILSMIADYAGCSILTMPIMLGLAKTSYDVNENSILDVFKAIPYNSKSKTDEIETSFITLYTSQKSSVLDNEKNDGTQAYKTDGFDIANTWGEIVPQPMFSDGKSSDFIVPAFGVTFAKQNQSYFKDIRLSMEDHQTTEYAIRNTIMISYMNDMGPKETSYLGQDLYSVYSNYSYSCTVSMMGDAQITPLMYFQLNNIAMWKGAYLITNVHHEISVNGMETVFTGVRQARPTLPFKDSKAILGESEITKKTEDEASQNHEEEGKPEEDINISKRRLDLIDVEKVEFIVLVVNRMSVKKMTEGYNFIDGTLDANVYYIDKSRKPDFITYVANTLEPYSALKGKIEDYVPEENDTYFAIPSGRYSKVSVENIPVNSEYRDDNDSFYKFTDGKHILVTDDRLVKKDDKNSIIRLNCEIITGATSMENIDGGGISKISYGGTFPIFLQADNPIDINKQFDREEIRATYREVFDLVRRMGEAKKPISLFIKESDGLPTKEIKE